MTLFFLEYRFFVGFIQKHDTISITTEKHSVKTFFNNAKQSNSENKQKILFPVLFFHIRFVYNTLCNFMLCENSDSGC